KTTLSGSDAATKFLQAYILELSLSMDNLFVFATILTYFRVPLANQHRVLVWGILGAVILRGVAHLHRDPHAHARQRRHPAGAQHLHPHRAEVVSLHRGPPWQQVLRQG